MNKGISLVAAALLTMSAAVVAAAQTETIPQTQTTTTTTVTKTVQNPDGTYSVVEYPLKKETTVTLNPIGLANSTGVATILRDDDGTRVVLNLTGVPADVQAMNVFAIDETGAVVPLGPVVLANGTGKFSGTTALSKFMLITAPDESLTAYDPNAKIYFRSVVPTGFAVIPHTTSPVGETVGATATSGGTPASVDTVPMLNIPAYKKGDETKLKVNFTGAMSGARANIFIEPHKHANETEINMRFHDLKQAPQGEAYILWAVSQDNQFFKLGEIANINGKNEAEIKANTSLDDFGLLVTMEQLAGVKTVVIPAGPRVGVIQITP